MTVKKKNKNFKGVADLKNVFIPKGIKIKIVSNGNKFPESGIILLSDLPKTGSFKIVDRQRDILI
jgi:hypothetical protein